MTRAYRPALSTVQLADDLRRAMPGTDVRIVAPHRGVTVTPARIRLVDASYVDATDPRRTRYLSLADARAELGYHRAIAYAAERGRQDGAGAAEWFAQDTFGGRVTRGAADAARRVLAGLDGADGAWTLLEATEYLPAPDLSGQWAGALTGPELAADAVADALYGFGAPDVPERVTVEWFADICDAYETAFTDAVAATVERLARSAAEPVA